MRKSDAKAKCLSRPVILEAKRRGSIRLFLTFLLSIALAACGGDSSTSANDDNESSSSSVSLSGTSVESNGSKASSSSKKAESSSSQKIASSSSSVILSSSRHSGHDPESSSSKKDGGSSSSIKALLSSSSSKFQNGWSWDIPLEDRLNSKINCGSMTDSRDGQTYKTIKIGNQLWMAQNLNYADSNKTTSLKGSSWCYGDKDENCKVAGCLYTWAAAMDSVGLFNKYGESCGYGVTCWPIYPVQGICPDGWRLPSKRDWEILDSIADGKLRSQTGWEKINGSDSIGFSALPVGIRDKDGFYYAGEDTYFWSSSVFNSSGNPYIMNLNDFYESASLTDGKKYEGRSIRCLENSDLELLASEYVPFDHSRTLANVSKVGEDAYKQFTDPRNGRSYYYITITSTRKETMGKSVTVMAENLNIGEMVHGKKDQSDDSKIEKYCYANDTTKCDEFGGLYQWAEMMQLPSRCNTESCSDLIQENHRGICPEGWRLFTWDDYEIVRGYDDKFDDGIKGLRSTYGFRGTNQSGFSLTGAGVRDENGEFCNIEGAIFWFFPEEHEYDIINYVHAGYVSSIGHAPAKDDGDVKIQGRSVRCVKLE